MAGCPKKDAVRAAVDASYRLPATTNDVIRQVADARDRGIITVEQSKKFGDLLNKMATAEVVYVGMVKTIEAALKSTGSADPGKLKDLSAFFDTSVVTPFLAVLEFTKLLSGDNVQLILLAVTAARLLLRTIGSGIGSMLFNKLAKADAAGEKFYYADRQRQSYLLA